MGPQRRLLARWLPTSAVALAIGMGGCVGGRKTGGTTGGISGSTGSSGQPTPTGTTSGTSGENGSSTTSGGADGGCPVGSPMGLPEGAVCLFPFDCGCGLICGTDVSGSGGNLVCEVPCALDSDCPLPGEHCQTALGFCQGGLGGACAANGSPNLEFYGCRHDADCPCPLECYGDPVLGPACERPCNGPRACGKAGEYCSLEVGSCQQSCNKDGLVTEFQACQEPIDCKCPLSCFADALRGEVCELPCTSDADCTGAGELCETDAGSCQRRTDCFGPGGGLPAFSACLYPADCACPLSCVDDPALQPPGATQAYRFCEVCDAGGCQSVPGSCQPRGDGGLQSSDVVPCSANSDCTCPNTCVGSAGLGGLRCEQACAASAGCDDPAQFCVAGQCVENYCDGQLLCDLANGREDPPDAGDGTCLRLPPYGDYVCRAGGTAAGQCDPQADRSDSSELCGKGLTCVEDVEDGGFGCARACALDSDCGPRGLCQMDVGLCLTSNDGGACPAGGELNAYGSCQYGECQGTWDAGLLEVSGLEDCSSSYPGCTCPTECLQIAGEAECIQNCSSPADCVDPGQTCVKGQCANNSCSGNALACDLDGASADGGLGTCLPDDASGVLKCVAPGTATGNCGPQALRSQASDRCAQGFVCLPVLDGGSECLPACVTSGDCGQGRSCVPSSIPAASVCLELNDAGTCALGQSSPPAASACGNPGNAACGCGYACVTGSCEQTCVRDSDCLVPADICVGTVDESYCVPGD